MRAVGITRFGGPEVLEIVELPVPEPRGLLAATRSSLPWAAGLRVIADAAPADAGQVRRLGADAVVPRGPQVAAAIRQVALGGVDALVDAAVMGQPVLAAVRDGGEVAAVRPFRGQAERSITVTAGARGRLPARRGQAGRAGRSGSRRQSRYGWQQNSPLSAHPKRTA